MKKPFAKNRIDYIVNLINPNKKDRVLNIGISNIPEIEMKIENKVKECYTLDLDQDKLTKAGKFIKKTKVIYGNLMDYDFKDKIFDKVVILEVLEHLDQDKLALERISKILKKGGEIIVSVPNKSILHLINPVRYFEHKRHYSNQDIIKLLENSGFKIEHFNLVEDWRLMGNLYIHLFFKYILRKNKDFNTLDKKENLTYSRINKNGMDIVLKAVKI